MRIIIPEYAKNYDLIPVKTDEQAEQVGLIFSGKHTSIDVLRDYVVVWGHKPIQANYGAKYGVMETGFFHNASFIDTVGNYQSLSLNTSMGFHAVAEFELGDRLSAKEIVFNAPVHKQSKYNAEYNETDIDEWTGPVLILQNPTDRSIMSVTSKEKYLQFIKDACRFYGKHLFVKFHPWNSGENFKLMEDIVKPFGCKYGKAKMSIINNAEFCIAYNSTFAVDAVLRDVPYVQYGMGTFFNSYGIIYTEGEFPSSVQPVLDAYRLADFLIHKFCFNKSMDKYKFAKMLQHYAYDNSMFPMTDEFSYASNLNYNEQ